mgnify:CR=1 FL=1
MKNKIKLGLIFLMFIALAFSVNATVGVTSFYYENNPLMVKPGEIKDIMFTLQNNGEGFDAKVTVVPGSGEEIAQFTDENFEYDVPLGSSGIPVPIAITIPEDAKPGDEWTVSATFNILYNPKDEGAVQLTSTYIKDFKVIVEESTPTTQATKKINLLDSPVFSFIILIIILTYI